jgi:hypothetical protein
MMGTYRLDKHAERELARILGGRRVGHLGGADVIAGHLCAEVKTRRRLPRWLVGAVQQAEGYAGERLPVAILHQAGERYDQALVVCRLGDWLDWYGGGGDGVPEDDTD